MRGWEVGMESLRLAPKIKSKNSEGSPILITGSDSRVPTIRLIFTTLHQGYICLWENASNMKWPCRKHTPILYLNSRFSTRPKLTRLQTQDTPLNHFSCVHRLKPLEGLRRSLAPVEHGACCRLPFRLLWLRFLGEDSTKPPTHQHPGTQR